MADTATTGAAEAAADTIARLEARLAREQEKVEILAGMIEDKTRHLYLAQEEMRDNKVYLESILRSLFSALFITDFGGIITSIGGVTKSLTKLGRRDLIGQPVSRFLNIAAAGAPLPEELCGAQHEADLIAGDGGVVPVLVNVSKLRNDLGEDVGVVFLATDLSERRRLEMELRHAQRLEAIGQLAAGVAHEINTPIQFVGDSARFLGDVVADVIDLLDTYHQLKGRAAEAGLTDAVRVVEDKSDEIDLAFLLEEAPKAVARTLEGVSRIATIVNALKQFSHPGGENMAPADLNQIIETTLVVAKNEYKYVADVRMELGVIPEVTCHRGDIGQVLINLVVNAAHALNDRFGGTDQRGEIVIRSRLDDDGRGVVIEVADTGGGIPEEIRQRVFEPFFTTKEVGRGTGQGLAIAHNVVVVKHKGRLSFDVDDGVGTTFQIWLPLAVGAGM